MNLDIHWDCPTRRWWAPLCTHIINLSVETILYIQTTLLEFKPFTVCVCLERIDDDISAYTQTYGDEFSGSRHEGRVTNPALRPTTTTTRTPRITGKPETPTKTPTKKPIHPPKPHPRPPHGGRKPNTCDTTYDAISIIRRELFIFKDRVGLF